ncbi:MAG TPA: rhomboid family intramembrane serine protease [Steroidobacter sp.]|uniref:rhomboid family intramembrane serine protease n=1 Tax=Steroidobacter sp. TaxID=1978227 RepID=UPI002ED8B4EC
MQPINTGPGDVPVSPKDGQIDFSKYSTEQLQDLRHTIDGRSHPQNLRNLLAELSKREAAGPDTIRFRDLQEFAVRFTPRDGLVGWVQGVFSRSTLYGSGVIRFEGADLAIAGWQKNWMGVALETELRVSMADVSQVEMDECSVSFDAQFQDGRRRRIRCLLEDAAARQAIFDKLPATSVSPLSASAAEWREFNRELSRMTPHAAVTGILILLNVITFAALLFSGSGFWNANLELLTRWGANTTSLTTAGQGWRLISALFLHAGFIHLLLNMWVLWGIGRLTERLYGNALFAVIYASAGCIASLSSIAWHPFVISVGASGAVFGAVGACLAFFLRSRTHIPRGIVWRHGLATAVFILFNLVSGFMSGGIDNAAHVGGLLTGLVLGFLLARPVQDGERIALKPLRIVVATGYVLLAIGSGVWQMRVMDANRPAPAQYWATHLWFLEGQAKALQKQAELQAAATSGSMSSSQLALRFEPEVFVFWRDAYERLKAEPEPQDIAAKDFAADVTEFARRRYEWASAMLSALKTDDAGSFREAMYYIQSADQAGARLNRHELRAVNDPSHALSQSRFVRLLRNLPARFTWKCVSDDVGPIKGKTTDGIAARHAAGCDAQRAFETEDFASLEAMLHPKDGELVNFEDGSSRVEGAIAGLGSLLERASAPGPILTVLAKWRREFPLSDGPDLIEALFFQRWAWQARGHGYAKEVSPQAWAEYAQRIEMADGALRDAADKSQRSPAYYPLAISLGVDQSKAREDLQRLVELSLQDFPEYYPPHRAMLRTLLPKWGGSYVEIDDYVEYVQARLPAERRREMYARLYTTFAALEGDEVDLFLETIAKWPKVKEGYQDMLIRYPHSDWLRNLYAGMACRARDAEVYHALMSELEGRVLPEAWTGKYSIEMCNERVSSGPKIAQLSD